MVTVKSPGIMRQELKSGEIYMMECNSGYYSYYSFGTDPKEMFREIVKMYNGYCSSPNCYNVRTFRKLCMDDGFSVLLYRIDTRSPFHFNDDVYGIAENENVVELGDYLEMTERSEKE